MLEAKRAQRGQRGPLIDRDALLGRRRREELGIQGIEEGQQWAKGMRRQRAGREAGVGQPLRQWHDLERMAGRDQRTAELGERDRSGMLQVIDAIPPRRILRQGDDRGRE